MKLYAACLGALCLAGSVVISAQQQDVTTPGIPGVVANGTKVQTLATWERTAGGGGPAAMPDGSVVFVQQNIYKIMKIDANGTLSTFLETMPNRILALAYDRQGRLIGTQQGQPRGLAVFTPKRAMLVEMFNGQWFGTPNDLVVDRKGGVYFTDNMNRLARPGQTPPPADGKAAIYYYTPSGQLLQITDIPPEPNGIQISLDGKVVYLGSRNGDSIMALDVQPDGRVANARKFAQIAETGKSGGADGMTVDAGGRLYVAANDGVMVFSPQGQHLGTIPVPIKAAHVAFAGKDRKTLFIISAGGAYKVEMLAEGIKR